MTSGFLRVVFTLVYCCMVSIHAYGEISVTDYLGRTVSLSKPAQRVVGLAPHIIENIASAGGVDRIVGAVDYSDFPPQANRIPRVGGISHFSVEAIVGLKPDLVIVWMPSKGGEILQQLASLGINTYANDPKTLPDVARSIRDYGVLLGTVEQAETQARTYLKDLARLRKENDIGVPVTVFYQVWHQPLQTLNRQSIISDVIRLCGGVNVFADLPSIAPKISVESVLAKNPQAIIASGMGEARPDWLDMWKKWPSLQAVQKQQLYFIPPDILQRHSVRILKGAQMLCDQLDGVRQLNPTPK